MRCGLCALLVALAWIPGVAGASSYVEDTLSLNTTRQTESNPQTGAVSDNLSGQWQATEALSVGAHAMLTHDKGTPSQAFPDHNMGGNIGQLGVFSDFDATKHLTLSGSLDLSPRAKQDADAPITLPDPLDKSKTISADALLHTESSSLGGTLGLTFDSSDPDADEPRFFEFALGATAGATALTTDQKVTELGLVNPRTGKPTPNLDKALTDAFTKACAGKKASICKVNAGEVTQFPLTVDATGTFAEDTDVGLTFTYYAYNTDPTTVGYFQVAGVGRTGGQTLGSGVPLAPQQYVFRPDVDHVFGMATADLFAEYGSYVDDQGHEVSVGLKLKLKINHTWRITAGATFTRETPGAGLADTSGTVGEPINSSLLSAGVRYTF